MSAFGDDTHDEQASAALVNAATHGTVRRRDLAAHPAWLAQGIAELANARRKLLDLRGSDIAVLNAQAKSRSSAHNKGQQAGAGSERTIDRIAVTVVNAARIVPWRSDCLVQAMAAQNWLSKEGLASHIEVGLPPEGTKGFEPHAWLVCGNRVVTGGDVRDFSVLLGRSA